MHLIKLKMHKYYFAIIPNLQFPFIINSLIFFFAVWKLFVKLFSLALYNYSKDNSLMLTVGLEPTTSAL
jgi:hypothetical protein